MLSSRRTSTLSVRSVGLLVALAMVVPVGGVAAAEEPSAVGPVYPWTAEWQEFTVDVGDTVLLGARWGACTAGLAWSARNALSFEYALDGNSIAAEFTWARPIEVPRESPPWACVSDPNGSEGWWILAEHPIIFDTPGDYEISVVVTSRRPLIDGNDLDGDGRPDTFLEEPLIATSTVHVIEP